MENGKTVGEWHTCPACTPGFYRKPVEPPPPGWSVADTSVPVSEQVGPFPVEEPAASAADLSEAQRQLFVDGWGLVSTWAGGWAEMDSPGGVRMWVDAAGEKHFGAPMLDDADWARRQREERADRAAGQRLEGGRVEGVDRG